jgi:hypothetical protein
VDGEGTFLVQDSTIVADGANAVFVSAGGTINATIRDNVIVSNSLFDPELFLGTDFDTINANISGNTLDGGNGSIVLGNALGTFNVTQLDPALNDPNSLDEANGIPEGNVIEFGPINYGQPAPPLP